MGHGCSPGHRGFQERAFAPPVRKTKGLKQSTLEAKVREAYKQEITDSDLAQYESRFDRNRELKSGVVRHFMIDKPDRSNGLLEFLYEDNQCRKWAITRALHMEDETTNRVRVTPFLREKAVELDWSGITFPTSVRSKDIFLFL